MINYEERIERFKRTNSQVEKLKEKFSECETLSERIRSQADLLNMDKLLRNLKKLTKEINEMIQIVLQLMEGDWRGMTDDIKQLSTIKMDILVDDFNKALDVGRNAGLDIKLKKIGKEELNMREITERSLDLSLTTAGILYFSTVYSIVKVIEEENLLSESDLKKLGLEFAEWVRTFTFDIAPFSGIILKAFNLILEHLSGKDINEVLWNSWADNIKKQNALDLLEKTKRKALAVIGFYVFHLKGVRGLLDFGIRIATVEA
jgi:hypothetical protein